MKRKLSRKKEFYVYALLDTRKPGPFYYGHWKFSYEPFYVGKGKGTRAYEHINGREETRNSNINLYKSRKIHSIRRSNLEPLVTIKREGLTEKQAFDLEIVLICKIGRSNLNSGPLTNLTDGGDGIPNWVRTDEIRSVISRNTIRQMKNMSNEDKANRARKISDTLKRKYACGDRVPASDAISIAKHKAGSFYDRMTKKQRLEYSLNRSRASKAQQEKLRKDKAAYSEFCAKVGEASKVTHENMTVKQKMDRSAKISRSIKKWHSNMTTEQKANRSVNIRNGMKNG